MTSKEEHLINYNFYNDLATGLYNKNYFIINRNEFANNLIKSIQNKTIFSVLFCDIDGLKLTNDVFGHLEADKGIKYIATVIKSDSKDKKKDNIVIRFGGDEFITLLPNCSKKKALAISKKIKQDIIANTSKTKGMTLAIGTASSDELSSNNKEYSKRESNQLFNKLLKLAEKNMFIDKNKQIKDLTYTEKKNIVLKHINRIGEKIGFNIKNPKHIDLLIGILEDLKEDIKKR